MRNKLVKRILVLGAVVLLVGFLNLPLKAETFIKSLTLQNADIHSVLSFLADYGKVNIVTAPSVKLNITMTLRDVTWKQALDIVLRTYGLTGVEEAGYIRVLPQQEYMDEQMTNEKHKSDQKNLMALQTEVVQIKNATAAEIIKPIKTVLSERGVMDVDNRTNSVIIRDIPENLSKAKAMIDSLDKETDQIKISAQLLEVDSKAVQELGINWTFFTSKGTEGTPVYNDITVDQKADKVSDVVGQLKYTTIQSNFDLNAVVSALISDDKARIVAHPEITTVDNKEAVIQMGKKIPIKQFDPSGNVVTTFVEVGTILKVIPHITSENRILMKLKPEQSSYQFDPNGVIISTNNAETNVVVQNGQTAVIGGLTFQKKNETNSGLPVLKDIPLIGYLFRYTKKSTEKTDLVIFVTPTIVTKEMKGISSTFDLPQPEEEKPKE